MYKNILYLFTLISITSNAQVGVNTSAPQGVFHVNSNTTSDPNNNNKTDDVIISNTGNVGIGLINPAAKLDIKTTGTTAAPVPGIKIVDGNQADGRVLHSDANGLATWEDIVLFNKAPIVGTFSWAADTNLGNNNFNSISSISLTPGTHMIYIKLHVLTTATNGYFRTYVGTKNLGTNNSNAGGETPIFGSTNFQPFIGKDFEMTQSFVYTNTTSNNITIYFNVQSDVTTIQHSRYTYDNPTAYKGVNLMENYFFSIPAN
jgi:hypothetical protein